MWMMFGFGALVVLGCVLLAGEYWPVLLLGVVGFLALVLA